LTAAAAIDDFVKPARVPGFRFGFGTGFVFFGILMVATRIREPFEGASLIRPLAYFNSAVRESIKPKILDACDGTKRVSI
jgi:hypothetical protein